ncbi:hypothetical protein ABPG72_006069 [Tetrahymena utriculariae]
MAANRTKDLFPGFKTAGASTKLPDESAMNCIKPKENLNPGTPEHIKKYRKSYKNQPGQTILHYGIYDDQKPPETFVYGKKIEGSDHVQQVMDSGKTDGIKQMINEIKEAKYHSRQVEPLGKRMERNYEFPQEVHQNNFKFGLATINSENTAKEVMFPQKPSINDQAAHDQYVRSHGNYEAGEQKNRNYNWKVDPQQHRFGKTDKIASNEVVYCLNQEALQDQFPKTTIVQKKQEDFRNFKEDHLGLPKNLGQTNAKNNPDMVFGARLGGPDEWNAGKCISGEATLKEVQTDKDLGKTNRFGFRNVTKEGDENRVFGVPTIRNDIMKPQMKSIADPNNYGDEKPAVSLLFPKKYDYMGVEQDDFKIKRHKYEIKDIFEKIGYKYKIGKFEGIFKRALEIENSTDNKASCSSFLQAIQEMDHIE